MNHVNSVSKRPIHEQNVFINSEQRARASCPLLAAGHETAPTWSNTADAPCSRLMQ